MYLLQGLSDLRIFEGHCNWASMVLQYIVESSRHGKPSELSKLRTGGRGYWAGGVATVINQVIVNDDAD